MIVELEDFKTIVSGHKFALTSMPGDPIHPGHISCLQACKRKFDDGTIVACLVNGDEFLRRKKGFAFMPLEDRCAIIDAIKSGADYVVPFNPSDPTDMTVCEAIRQLKPAFFLKGGDRTADETLPEWSACQEVGCQIIDHVGADKSWSSSNYLAQHKAYVEDLGKVEKPWGWFKTLRKTNTCAVKELHVNPGECLSLQRHMLRKEKWLVVSGIATVTVGYKTYDVEPGEIVSIGKRVKHRLENKTQDELVISEWWLGNSSEDDVKRFEDKYGRCGQDMD